MSELQATEIRKGHVIRWENSVWTVINVDHITPGNWRAIIQIKMRNLQTGSSREQRFSSGDKLELVHTEVHDFEYLYQSGANYVFMNLENYEQIELHKELLGEDAQWLKENLPVKIHFLDGSALEIELPPAVDLKVVQTEPQLKGATVTNVYKPAKLETGAVVQVPPFIAEGEIIRVDTRSGEYLERAGK
ncbi:MAG TPA: elongation factor P [Planctomycetota bacterium]|nr:elongation factor P [Planctomycetota bacterium]